MCRLRKWILTVMAIAVASLAQDVAGTAPKKGQIRVKLQPEMALKVAKLPQIQTHGAKSTGITPLDVAASKAKTTRMRPMLPYSAKYAAKRAKYGLDRWYVIEFDETMSSDEVRAIYASTAGVERSEVITPMSLKEGNGTFRKINPSLARAQAAAANPMPFNDPLLSRQWHYQNFGDIPYTVKGADINLFDAWKITTGSKNVLVAVIDGGVDYTHEDLAANMYVNEAELNGTAGVDDDGNGYVDDIYGYNFCTNEGKVYPHSHGTHVAGTVAAVNNNGIGVAGVAGGDGTAGTGVKMISCQVFDPRSGTADGDFAAAIVYACEKGATIGQCSWGWNSAGYYEQAVLDAIDYFTAEAQSDNMKGGLLFFAMGNEGVTGDFYPGCYEKVVGVAAMTSELTPASYSCNGPGTDIVAPGGLLDYGEAQGVLSTLPNNEYGYNEGTSMATPHVSGTAALILSKYGSPTFLNETLRTQIITSVNDFYGHGNNSAYAGNFGSGYLDAAKAVNMNSTGSPEAVDTFNLVAAQDYIVVNWIIPASADNNINNHIIYYSKEPFTAADDLAKLPSKIVDTKFLTSGDETSYEITGLDNLTTYYVAIQAVNRWGNASALSEVKSVRTNEGPKMTVAESSLSMTATASEPVATASLTIGNEAEGILKWSAATRTVSAQLQSRRPLPGTMSRSKIKMAGSPAKTAAVAARAEYEAADYPQEITDSEQLYAMIGETDKSLPNSLAQWFKVDPQKYPEGFNLTSLWFDAPSDGIYGANPRIAIYKGNVAISQASLITEVDYMFFTYNYNINLTEQLWFAPGESFWVVAHFDAGQEGYPLPMGYSSDTNASANSYMSTDGGASWMKLSEALRGSSWENLSSNMVWGVKARSLNPDWSSMLELDPASGSVLNGETQKIDIHADGSKLVNGTYKFNVRLSTNESGSRVVSVPASLSVSCNEPSVVVPKVVDFGSLLVGQSKTVSVEFYNQGYGSFRGSQWGAGIYSGNITSSSDDFRGPDQVASGFPARSKTVVELTYSPTTSGSHSGTITFKDKDGREVKVLVQGVATEPARLVVNPAVIDADTLTLGADPKELSFTVRNDGKYPLEYVFPKFSDETVEGAAALHKFGYTVSSTLEGYTPFEYEQMPALIGATDIASKFTDAVYVSSPISLGFEFPYYGKSYDKVYITSFGGVMFALNDVEFRDPLTPRANGVSGTGLISAYGRQLQMGADSKVEYGKKDGKFVVNFRNVLAVVYGTDYSPVSFHLTLDPSGNIEIFYDDFESSMLFQEGSTIFCGINDPELADVLTITSADMADYWSTEEPTADNTRFRLFTSGTAVRFEAPQASFVRTLAPAYGLVAPGDSVDVKMTVSVDGTMNAGETFNNLAIVTNDPEPTMSAVRVNAYVSPEGMDAALAIESDAVDFGKVFRTSVVEIPVTVKNAGHNGLTVSDASFADGKMTVAFTEPVAVKPGSSVDLIVTVPTDTEGKVSDSLKVATTAGDTTIVISGEVIGCPDAVLSFESVEETLESGTPLSKTLEISNAGNEPMTYSVSATDNTRVVVPERDDTEFAYTYASAADKQTTFDWVDIETTGLGEQNAFRYYNLHDYKEVELPFEFPFYGKKYKKMYIYNTGFISFTERHDDKIWPEPPADFPNGSIFTNIIAPYWGLHSMNTTKTAGTYHYVTADRAVVSFMEYGNSMNYGVCFQVILEKDGSFKFQYKGYDEMSIIMGAFGLAGIANADGSESIQLAERQIAFDNAVSFTPVRQNLLKPGEKDAVELTFDTDRMAGLYESTVNVATNVPSRENIAIPVNLNITGQAAPSIPDSVVVEHVLGYTDTDMNNPVVQLGACYDAPFSVANNGTATFTVVGLSYESPMVEDPDFGYEYPMFQLLGRLPELDWMTGEPTGNYQWQMVEPDFFTPMEIGKTPLELSVPMMQGEAWMTPGVYEIPVTVTYTLDADSEPLQKTVKIKFVVTPAPYMTFDRDQIYVKAETDDQVTVETLKIGNEGEYDLTYSLRLDPSGVGEEAPDYGGGIDPMLAARFKAATKAVADDYKEVVAAQFAKKIKLSDNNNPYELPSNFEFTNALYYDAMPGSTGAWNYGTGNLFDIFKESVYFKAPKTGFNISHIYMPVTIEDQTDVNIKIEIIAGADPEGTEVIGSGVLNVKSQDDPQSGQFFVVKLDKPVFVNPDEEFCVVVTYPENLLYPSYLNVKEEPVTSGRYMGWTEESGWFDIAELLQDQVGSVGYILTCLETQAGEPWIKLLNADTEGTVEVGSLDEIKVQVNAAAARKEKDNRAVIVIKSNDPNQPLVNYPVVLDLNGKPVIDAPASRIYAREGEITTVSIPVTEPDGDTMLINIADESGIATLKSVTVDAADQTAEVIDASDGAFAVIGATMPVTLTVEIAPDYGQAGSYAFEVNVLDEKSHAAQARVSYEVEKVNRAPRVVDFEPAEVSVGQLSVVYDFSSFFEEPDGDELTYEFSMPANDYADAFTTSTGVVFRGKLFGETIATVKATDPQGLSAIAEIPVKVKEVSAIDGIESDGSTLVRIVENPVKETLRVRSLVTADLRLELFDMSGAVIYSGTTAASASEVISIGLGASPAGFYILRASDGSTTETYRIVRK